MNRFNMHQNIREVTYSKSYVIHTEDDGKLVKDIKEKLKFQREYITRLLDIEIQE